MEGEVVSWEKLHMSHRVDQAVFLTLGGSKTNTSLREKYVCPGYRSV